MKILLIFTLCFVIYHQFELVEIKKRIPKAVIDRSFKAALQMAKCHLDCIDLAFEYDYSICDKNLQKKLKQKKYSLDKDEQELYLDCLEQSYSFVHPRTVDVFANQHKFIKWIIDYSIPRDNDFVRKQEIGLCVEQCHFAHICDSECYNKYQSMLDFSYDDCQKTYLFGTVEPIYGTRKQYEGINTVYHFQRCLQQNIIHLEGHNRESNFLKCENTCLKNVLRKKQTLFVPPQPEDDSEIIPHCPQCYEQYQQYIPLQALHDLVKHFQLARDCQGWKFQNQMIPHQANLYQSCLAESDKYHKNNAMALKISQCKQVCLQSLIQIKEQDLKEKDGETLQNLISQKITENTCEGQQINESNYYNTTSSNKCSSQI